MPIEQVLIPQANIVQGVRDVAYAAGTFNPTVIVGIAIAGLPFAIALCQQEVFRQLPLGVISFKVLLSGRVPRELCYAGPVLEGQRVLLVDSCLDSGRTLCEVSEVLRCKNIPYATAVVVDKNVEGCDHVADYCIYRMDRKDSKRFLFGYGMDDKKGYRRGLPHVMVTDP